MTQHPTISNFYVCPIDLAFYTVRSNEFYENFTLPGSHGFNSAIQRAGKLLGKINIKAEHFGWYRSRPEYREAYNETGVTFGEDIQKNNAEYYGKQCVSYKIDKSNLVFDGPFFTEEN